MSIAQMKTAGFNAYGKPASSHIVLYTAPVPLLTQPDQVLVAVRSAALNPIDYKTVEGALKALEDPPLPCPLGFDVSGEVTSVGGSVTRFKVGESVYGRVDHHNRGTLSEWIVTSESSLAPKPDRISHDEAAAVPLVTLTALQSIRDVGKMKEGDKILILGGSGGVGVHAIQVAKILGASEIIVTCSASNEELCRLLGATRVIDYKTQNYVDEVKDVDFVFDTTGDANNAFKTVKKGGTVVSIIAAFTLEGLKRGKIELSLAQEAMFSAMSAPTLALAALHGAHYHFVWMKSDGDELREVNQWIEAGLFKPVIDKTFIGFDQIRAAFAHLESGHAKGKVVVQLKP